jgi:hypothetical protein
MPLPVGTIRNGLGSNGFEWVRTSNVPLVSITYKISKTILFWITRPSAESGPGRESGNSKQPGSLRTAPERVAPGFSRAGTRAHHTRRPKGRLYISGRAIASIPHAG